MGVKDENNNENKQELDAFDSEPGYFYQVVRPMLKRGHEIELILWMRDIGLIPNTQTCTNSKLGDDCKKNMEWIPAKVNDYYQWKCKNCPEKKKSIRENSIFSDVKCSLNNATRILLGWCKGYDVESMSNILGVKKHVVKTLYGIATTTARKSLKCHVQNHKLGGPGTIVIVDTYPEGCTNYNKPIRRNRPILCLAEVKNIPPSYWFEALDRYTRNNLTQVKEVKEHILSTIQDIVMPGSILVTRLSSTLCSYYDLQCLRAVYPTIVSIEGLSRHDTHNQSILINLESIWKLAVDVCEDAQLVSYGEVPNFLTKHMWHSRFGAESFEMLINRLTEIVR